MDTPPKKEAAIAQDFQRDVWCLFGLPVDNLTMASTKTLLRERVNQEGTTVLSTINVNWVVQSFADPEFRSAILNSDLVTLDGKPLLWLAKLLGCPMRETVPGSSLIEELMAEESHTPLTIFLFGGEGNTAELAMDRINQGKGGLRAVGALNPGFGTVEEMSSDAIFDAINSTKPDILLVALGAQKGTQWIERNRNQLNAKIISHLGATINFLAGTVKRAPRFMQGYGLEWLWRIVQEPKLFSRYALDGLVLLRVLLSRLPLWLRYLVWCRSFSRELRSGTEQWQESERAATVTLGFCPQLGHGLRDLVCRAVLTDKELVLDFQDTKYANGAFLGLLLLLQKHQQRKGKRLTFINMHERLKQISHLFCFQNASAGATE